MRPSVARHDSQLESRMQITILLNVNIRYKEPLNLPLVSTTAESVSVESDPKKSVQKLIL